MKKVKVFYTDSMFAEQKADREESIEELEENDTKAQIERLREIIDEEGERYYDRQACIFEEDYIKVLDELKRIVFWRKSGLTCEQEVEKLLHELEHIQSKDKAVLEAVGKTKQ